MKFQELRQLQPKELEAEKIKLMYERFSLLMQHKSRSLKETHKLRDIKKQIARLNTFLSEKQKND
jgi:large subunit ribosomal protein L29